MANRRIAVLAVSYVSQRDGVSVYTENLLTEMLKIANHNVQFDIFACGVAGEVLENIINACLVKYEIKDRIVFRVIKSKKGGWRGKYIETALNVNRCGPYDLIVIPNIQPLILFGSPRVSVLHDVTYKVEKEYFPIHRRLYLDMLLRLRVLTGDALGYISQTTKQDIFRFYPAMEKHELVYMPNGVPFKVAQLERPGVEMITRKLTSQHIQILFVGRVNYLKGFDRVLMICEKLEELATTYSFQSVTLHVVGKETNETGGLLAGKVFEKVNIIRHGYVDDTMLSNLYRDSAFCFFLSRNEGFGLPLIEAIWLGCVPILSDIPIFREIMGLRYPLFRPDDNQATNVFNFIQGIWENKEKRDVTLSMMEEAIELHKDGYKAAAYNVLKLHHGNEKLL